MAATISIANRSKTDFGGLKTNIISFTGDNAYSAGGYTVTANSCGLTKVVAVVPAGAAFQTTTTGRVAMPEIAAGGASFTLKFLGMGASAATTVELTETSDTDLSLVTLTLLVIGV